jgi:putative transcriptional regulator
MISQDFSNLTGKILIASPYTMEDNIFHQSIVYVVHHGDQGAVGFLVNRLVKNPPVNNLFKKAEFKLDLNLLNLKIHIGGPLELERGFFLHSAEYNKNLLFKLENSELAVSSNIEILKDITSGSGPKHSMFAIGYTGWGVGQLEFEIQNNLWLISESDYDLIFGNDPTTKWPNALAKLNIDGIDFVPYLASC